MTQLVPRDGLTEAIAYLNSVLTEPVSDDLDAAANGSLVLPQVRVQLVASSRADMISDLFTFAVQGYAADRIDADRLTAEAFTRLLEWPETDNHVRTVTPLGGTVPFPDPDHPAGNRHQASVVVDLRPSLTGAHPIP